MQDKEGNKSWASSTTSGSIYSKTAVSPSSASASASSLGGDAATDLKKEKIMAEVAGNFPELRDAVAERHCQKSCGCKGESVANVCNTFLLACHHCWGNELHPEEKRHLKPPPWRRG